MRGTRDVERKWDPNRHAARLNALAYNLENHKLSVSCLPCERIFCLVQNRFKI